MLYFLCQIISFLSLSQLQNLGHLLGWIVYIFSYTYRKKLKENITHAGYNNASFLKKTIIETGAMILEIPKVWFREEYCLKHVSLDDAGILDAICIKDRGIIFLAPHVGCFEIIARYIAQYIPVTVMFQPPKKSILQSLINKRSTNSIHAVPTNFQGIREIVRVLKKNEAIGLLPDQVPSIGEGIWSNFFGRLAYTMTLPGKLALKTGALVIIVASERLPNGMGWRLHSVTMPYPLPKDIKTFTDLLNQSMENLIRKFPEQYLWSYNRYKIPTKNCF